jgi:TolB protein
MDADGTDKQTLNAGPGVNTQPDWSPDSQRLVFVSNRDGNGGVANGEIYRMKVDGTEVMRLTNNPEHDYQPAWSPDGQRIAFTRYWLKEPKQYRIFVMNADGSGETELTKTWGTRGGPRWSPDGQKLIFSQSVGGWNIYTMDLHTMTPPGTEVKLLIGGKSIEWEADWLIPR